MRRILGLAAGLLFALAAQAQSFPTKPVTLIVPWPAGGSTDIYFRKLGEVAARHLGQPLVIENKPGGSGMNGPATMAKTARPDGYTISQLAISAFRMPHMQKVDWDPINDFTYIIGLAGYTFGVVVRADSPFKTFQDLLTYARANPGKLSYATPGTGTSLHLAMEEVGGQGRRAVPAHPVQGLRRRRHRPDGRARHGAGGFDRLGQAGGRGRAAPARHARRQAHALGRADGEGARRGHGVELAVRPGRARKACRAKS